METLDLASYSLAGLPEGMGNNARGGCRNLTVAQDPAANLQERQEVLAGRDLAHMASMARSKKPFPSAPARPHTHSGTALLRLFAGQQSTVFVQGTTNMADWFFGNQNRAQKNRRLAASTVKLDRAWDQPCGLIILLCTNTEWGIWHGSGR